MKVLWIVSPGYHGAVVVRGHEVGAGGIVRFLTSPDESGDERIVDQISFPAGPGWNRGWRDFPSTMLLARRGCYALQVDAGSKYEVVFPAAP